MTDLIETPCIGVCAVDGMTGYCEGCGRRLKEIAGWRAFSIEERRTIMTKLPARMEAAGFNLDGSAQLKSGVMVGPKRP